MDQFYPGTALNMVSILEILGCRVQYNIEQTCCGQAAFNAGYRDFAKEVGEKFIREISPSKKVVCPSGSCTAMVKGAYTTLFQNTVLHNACKDLQRNLFEFSAYVLPLMKSQEVYGDFNAKVTYLDSCQGMRECGIREQPRELLSRIRGLELLEMSDKETCCGFGGIYSVSDEPGSVALGKHRLLQALESGVEFIVSSDSSCMMHLDAIIKKEAIPLKTIHIVDLLAKSLKAEMVM